MTQSSILNCPTGIQNRITHLDNSIFIQNLTITSSEIYETYKNLLANNSKLNSVTAFESLLEMGCLALRLGLASAEIECMKSTSQQLSSSFESTTNDAIKQFSSRVDSLVNPENGLLLRIADESLIKTREQINSLFIGDGAIVPTSLTTKLDEKFESFSNEIHRIIGQASSVIGQTFSMDSQASPLQSLKKDLIANSQDHFKQIADKIEGISSKVENIETRRKIINSTPKKGMPYEESVFNILSQIANVSGDDSFRTGQNTGLIANCKKGDITVSLGKFAARGHFVNLVFEAKSMSLSREEWRKELNLAMANRAAQVSIAVVQNVDQMPNKSRFSLQDSQQLMLAFDPEIDDPAILACIYNMAKAYAVSRSLEGNQINSKVITEAIEQLQSSLSSLDEIDGSIRTSRKAFEKIDSARICLKGIIENQTQRLTNLLDVSTKSESDLTLE